MNEKLMALMEDEEFMNELLAYETEEEVQVALSNKGVELTLDQLRQIRNGVNARLNDTDELSDDDLECVAGGAMDIEGIINGVAGFIVRIGDAVDRWTSRRW